MTNTRPIVRLICAMNCFFRFAFVLSCGFALASCGGGGGGGGGEARDENTNPDGSWNGLAPKKPTALNIGFDLPLGGVGAMSFIIRQTEGSVPILYFHAFQMNGDDNWYAPIEGTNKAVIKMEQPPYKFNAVIEFSRYDPQVKVGVGTVTQWEHLFDHGGGSLTTSSSTGSGGKFTWTDQSK